MFLCRNECIFTIDPATARDLDDALSCKRLPDGKRSQHLIYSEKKLVIDACFFLTQVTLRWGSTSLM